MGISSLEAKELPKGGAAQRFEMKGSTETTYCSQSRVQWSSNSTFMLLCENVGPRESTVAA